MIINFNDEINLQQKIFFDKSIDNDYNNSYHPYLTKKDISDKKYKISESFLLNNFENLLLKITIEIFTFSNKILLPIGVEEIYLKIASNCEMKKFHMYQNIHQKYLKKKIGNLNFDLSFKVEEFNYSDKNTKKLFFIKQLSVIFSLN